MHQQLSEPRIDMDPRETAEWLEALDHIVEYAGPERVNFLLNQLTQRARSNGVQVPVRATTPYVNTISVDEQVPYPGDLALERRVKSINRWNALQMVLRQNKVDDGIGGHIATYQSLATMLEVGFNHFFHASYGDAPGDAIYFQGHASPGVYARAFLEGRLTEEQLSNFRHELRGAPGLSSYPHPWLMPDFWQYPTVSMGLGPLSAIYHARFMRYLENRGVIPVTGRKVWAFLGDGEMDEPESTGALRIASQEGLDNLIFVINCNLQRLDGPVRGNGKVIQELEGIFNGGGWRTIKCIWGSNWDALLQRDTTGKLMQLMDECVDGEYQAFKANGGDFVRKEFFGRYPETAALVEHMTDQEIGELRRGGHDPIKVYNAYKAAVEHKGGPVVVLCKTVKGYGMGKSGESRNAAHQAKKPSDEDVLAFPDRFGLTISKEEIKAGKFYRPPDSSPEIAYMHERRRVLGGYVPARKPAKLVTAAPAPEVIDEFRAGSKEPHPSTTMAFVRLLTKLMNKLTVKEARLFFANIQLTQAQNTVADKILHEVRSRLQFLDEVGLDYLTLDRLTSTLSGGESQRIQLATSLGSHLVGALYVLDEPSIGLHPRDTQRLIDILKSLRDLGNTVLVVEHDPDTIRAADYVIDLGPGAGELGGKVLFAGSYQAMLEEPKSITGRYLTGDLRIAVPNNRHKLNGKFLKVFGAHLHNLRDVDLMLPLGTLTVVTGVSGSGKSTLVHDVLYQALAAKRNGTSIKELCARIEGDGQIREVVIVDQSPIGRTPRSNPATYLKAFDAIREVFADTPDAKRRGYSAGHFSFNVPGGRCETCQGDGTVTVEMQFLADVELICEECRGTRFKSGVLEVLYHGKSIHDVLQLTVREALVFFMNVPKIVSKLRVLNEIGLGYLRLGQSATTLSGGEAQRLKLAAHLSRTENQGILYILDEPTTGLHFDDIAKLLAAFRKLIESGASLLVIEHNLDVIKSADWLIDMGPEGGDQGGKIIATGTPEQVARNAQSHTGRYLARMLNGNGQVKRAQNGASKLAGAMVNGVKAPAVEQ